MSGLLFVLVAQTQNEPFEIKTITLTFKQIWRVFFLPWRQFRFPLWRLSFGFGVITVRTSSITCYKVLDKMSIFKHPTFKLLQADLQSILFLVNREESWNEFRCCPLHVYIFSFIINLLINLSDKSFITKYRRPIWTTLVFNRTMGIF